MAVEMDFPPGPILGQKYTAPSGIVYEWDGYGWVVGFYDTADQDFTVVGDLLDQIRTLLQDTDNRSGQYRYSTDSIIMSLNQGLMEMFRLRPDLFLENNYIMPVWNVGQPDMAVVIEQQYVPALIYYAIGMVQARDDEQTQDARAGGFIRIFQTALISGGVVTV